MKISIISGSHRQISESKRVSDYIKRNFDLIGGVDSSIISLAGNPLPLWDEGVYSGDEKWKSKWAPISNQLMDADAIVVVSPEWGGMVPPGLKNFFLLCSAGEIAHKPGLIVTVSASLGGSYPVNELRISSYKNSRICYIPDHVIVRQVGEMLKGDTAASAHDESLRKRIDYSSRVLLEYAKALKSVRESAILDYKNYPFGM